MDRLKQIEQALRANPNIAVGPLEISRKPYRRLHPGELRVSAHISVWPSEPTANTKELEQFVLNEVRPSIPETPLNICHSYEYKSMGKMYAKMGALFYNEQLGGLGEYGERERWVTVSVHPCSHIAGTGMIREVIPLGGYECSEQRCPAAKKCRYRRRRPPMPLTR